MKSTDPHILLENLKNVKLVEQSRQNTSVQLGPCQSKKLSIKLHIPRHYCLKVYKNSFNVDQTEKQKAMEINQMERMKNAG